MRASSTVSTGSVVPGTIGTPASRMISRARVFEPIASIALGGRADEDDAGLLAGAREGGVLGEEAVAGVDRLGAGLLGDLEDLVHREVALGGRAGAEQVRLVGAPDVRRVAIGLGVDRHAGDAELLERPHHADGDLAAVGDQDLARTSAGGEVIACRPALPWRRCASPPPARRRGCLLVLPAARGALRFERCGGVRVHLRPPERPARPQRARCPAACRCSCKRSGAPAPAGTRRRCSCSRAGRASRRPTAFGGDGAGRCSTRRTATATWSSSTSAAPGRSGLLRCRALERANLFEAGRGGGRLRAPARRAPGLLHEPRLRRRHRGAPRRARVEQDRAVRDLVRHQGRAGLRAALSRPAWSGSCSTRWSRPDGPDPFYRDTLAPCRASCARCAGGLLRLDRATRWPTSRLAGPTDRRARSAARAGGRRARPARARGGSRAPTCSRSCWPATSIPRCARPSRARCARPSTATRTPLLRLRRRAFTVDGEPPPPRDPQHGALRGHDLRGDAAALGPHHAARPGRAPAPRRRRGRADDPRRARSRRSTAPPRSRATLLDAVRALAAAPVAPEFGPGPLPDVPVLVLEGEDDLRTPVENARRVAALFPRPASWWRPPPGTRRSAPTSAAARSARSRASSGTGRWRPAARGGAAVPAAPPPPRAPRSACRRSAASRACAGARSRRMRLTLRDVGEDSLTAADLRQHDPDIARGGGLRAGRYRIDGDGTLELDGVRVRARRDASADASPLRRAPPARPAARERSRPPMAC